MDLPLQADRGFLQGLKEYQDRVQLNDEVAQEVMREAARAKLERCLDTALEAVKRRTRVRDYSPAIQVWTACHSVRACLLVYFTATFNDVTLVARTLACLHSIGTISPAD